jgi:hypothetical protein
MAASGPRAINEVRFEARWKLGLLLAKVERQRAIAIRDDRQQMLAIFGGRKDTDGLSHAHRLAHPLPSVNHPTVSVH